MALVFLDLIPQTIDGVSRAFDDLTKALIFKYQYASNTEGLIAEVGVIQKAHQSQKGHFLSRLADVGQFN